MKPFHDHLDDLRSKVKSLTETGLALNALFAGEENRLNREDEALSLKAFHSAIVEQVQHLKEGELFASRGYSQANMALSLGMLAAGSIMKIASRNKRLSAFGDYLLNNSADKHRPFGRVLICIGPRGLPDDARVVSISQLAREANRPESEIINTLQERGYLLYSEEAFSRLTDRLIDDIRKGSLHLPVSREELSEIMASNKPKLKARIIEVK